MASVSEGDHPDTIARLRWYSAPPRSHQFLGQPAAVTLSCAQRRGELAGALRISGQQALERQPGVCRRPAAFMSGATQKPRSSASSLSRRRLATGQERLQAGWRSGASLQAEVPPGTVSSPVSGLHVRHRGQPTRSRQLLQEAPARACMARFSEVLRSASPSLQATPAPHSHRFG